MRSCESLAALGSCGQCDDFELQSKMAAPTSLVEPVYSSVACNRTPNCLDWGNNGIVCFGAAHAIALYEPKVFQFLCNCRRGFVTCVFLT